MEYKHTARLKKTYLDKLQKTQNIILKVLFKSKDSNITTKEIYTKYKILNIRQLRDHTIVCENYFEDRFKKINNTKVEILRPSTYRFTVPAIINNYGKNNREYLIPTLFNKLPMKLLQIEGISKAKKEIKNYMIMNDWD